MTLFDLAQRLCNEIPERAGPAAHPFILWCQEATTLSATSDEIPWCSAFVNRLAWLLRLPRSKSAAARSWLEVGVALELVEARAAWDIVIFRRGTSSSEVVTLPPTCPKTTIVAEPARTYRGSRALSFSPRLNLVHGFSDALGALLHSRS